MAITHVNTQTGTQASATSVSATKPTGTVSGDVLLAFFASNNQTCTPPSGWTLMADKVAEVFRCQAYYKVAGGSEPSSYSFSVGGSAPLVLTVSAWRGCDTVDPFDIDISMVATNSQSEPYDTPTVTGGNSGRMIYMRSSRVSGSTPTTYSEAVAGASEISDVGVFSGGTVCYSTGLFSGDTDYAGSPGSRPGLDTTSSQAETHNITATLALKTFGVPGTFLATLPVLTVAVDGGVATPMVMSVTMPSMPDVDIQVWYGTYDGPLDIQVPIDVAIAASTVPNGSLAAVIRPVVSVTTETRRFAENVVTPDEETRWFIVTQDDIRIGPRNPQVDELVPQILLPTLQAQFDAQVAMVMPPTAVTASAYGPTVSISFPAGTANASCHN